MNRLIESTCLVLLCFLGSVATTMAQTLPVGLPGWEDAVRREQLTGEQSSEASMMLRPLHRQTLTGIQRGDSLKTASPLYVSPMPLVWKQQFNSDHPQGLNDGAMIPSKGYQTYLSGGVYAQYRWLSVQFSPEAVYAANPPFDGFSDALSDKYWSVWYKQVASKADRPERFGDQPYKRFFWGQSSVRLNWKALSVGLSTENLWWGPGYTNSLLMTNNAPGFTHLTLNTTRPIKTPIGAFEGQLVGGRLEASGYAAFDTARLAAHGLTPITRPDDWRYLNGLAVVYQPRWLPGLHLGAARSFVSYHSDMGSSILAYVPVLTPLLKKTMGNSGEDALKRNQLASIFFRWVMPEAGAELYGEYGREDHSYDLTDLALTPDHTRAYVLGFRKLTPLSRKNNSYVDIQVELTDLTKTRSSAYRTTSVSGWYTHYQVVDGYTHQGQILGAGIGHSSNMQWVSLAWTKGLKRIGLEGRRLAHEENFWAVVSQDYRTHWVDLGVTAFGEWDHGPWLVTARLETLGAINYQFLYAPVPSDPPAWWDRGPVRYNLHAQLGLTYFFPLTHQ